MFNAHDLTLTRGTRILLAGAHIHVPTGGLLCVVGANGAGKTSLLRCMAGLLPPQSGTIAPKADLHFISAAQITPTPITPRLFLNEHAALQNGTLTADPLGITPHLDTPLNRLSTGWRQRVNLTRLTLTHRPIWLLDEPTSGLDDAAITLFLNLITTHRHNDGCVIIATHQPHFWPDAEILTIGGEHA